jgi:hypothetical protein
MCLVKPANTRQQETERRHPRYVCMSTNRNTSDQPETQGNARKDPDEWVTGEESMTGAQASYLKTLCEEAGERFDPRLTKAEASKRIDELQAKTGRGRDH